jgi:hypothetical protein
MDTYITQIADRLHASTDEVLSFLESPAGKRLRKTIATGLIVSVPLVMRIPGLRKTFVGRAVEMVGGAALVIKLAELIRDWEREQATA